jgi:DNA-binding protein YbaB
MATAQPIKPEIKVKITHAHNPDRELEFLRWLIAAAHEHAVKKAAEAVEKEAA